MIVLDQLLFKLQKLTIYSFDNPERTGKKTEFQAMFNPDSLSRSFVNKFTKEEVSSSIEQRAKFRHGVRSTVRMKLILDGTNAHQYGFETAYYAIKGEQKSVADRIDDFLTNIANIKGEIHEPPFLLLSWGKTLQFNCRLDNLDIHYTLFDRSGNPLRAELTVAFIEDEALKEQIARLNLQSPDLTHYRLVKAGDQLPLMCQEIYGSPLYYTAVAKANKLVNFRNLTPGQEIYFPPIDK